MAQSSYPSGSDPTSDLKDKATDQLNTMSAQAQDVASRVGERGRELTYGLGEVAGNFKGALDKSLKDQRMATLAVAAGLGFVLGALWKA
jgi:hypothetical protein